MSTDERQLEKLLALHCAPVLKDRKVSNMFHIQRDSFDDLSATLSLYNGKLNQKGIHLTMFQQESERVTVFVYRRRRLALLLERKDVQAFLRELCGISLYHTCGEQSARVVISVRPVV